MTKYATLLFTLLTITNAHAAPPIPGSDDAIAMHGHEDWITSQTNSFGGLCCSVSDGRPTQDVRKRADGKWEALFSREHWPDGDGKWHTVPENAILEKPSPIFDAIVWFYRGEPRCVALPGVS